jgi:hypothetical protein
MPNRQAQTARKACMHGITGTTLGAFVLSFKAVAGTAGRDFDVMIPNQRQKQVAP